MNMIILVIVVIILVYSYQIIEKSIRLLLNLLLEIKNISEKLEQIDQTLRLLTDRICLSVDNAKTEIEEKIDENNEEKTYEEDPLLDEALEAITEKGDASASYLQRQLSIGYSRAARLLDQLEEAGYIGPKNGINPRKILK